MKKIILLISIVALSGMTIGQKGQAELLDSLFSAMHEKKSFNGNVLIADKGTVIFEKSYGFANEETEQKLNLETKFELASVSKQFTAMAIVLLQKMGKLNYDDKISTYIPELGFYKNITIKNLLIHTGGLPDYMDLFEEKWDKSKFATNQDIVDLFAKHKPKINFKPNKKFEYSNTGYALLGLIIERVSGKTFGQFLADQIFIPLEMTNTFVYRSRFEPKKVENYALGYVEDSLGNKVLPDSFGKEFYSYYLDGIVGDGMVNSNLGDLLKWDRALYTEQLVNEQDKALIFSSYQSKDGKDNPYGFGWGILNHKRYGKIVSHSGGWAGYLTYIERHTGNDKTIIILQNNATQKTILPVKKVRMILYNEVLENENLKKITLSSEELDKYIGEYSAKKFPIKITIFKDGTTLMAQGTGQGAIPMDSYENHTFKFEDAGIKMVFNPVAKTFELLQGGQRTLFKRK